jgi:DNA-binding winged helix-turn-helix (wHTH) protein
VLYRFEDYSLDPSRRELRRGRDLVAIEPLAFDLLEFLVRNRHRIVGKDLLIGEVWKRRAVSDSALSSRMTAVRHAVGDDAKEQRLIRTVPCRGFRFIGAVREEGEPGRGLARPFERGELLASAGEDTPSRPGNKRAIAVLPFAHDVGTRTSKVSSTASSRTSRPHSPDTAGSRSPPAVRASPTGAGAWTSGMSSAIFACTTCSREACGRSKAACASRRD